MKKRSSIEWILFATMTICFVFGYAIAPYYEQLFVNLEPGAPVRPLAFYFKVLGTILLVALLARLLYRWTARRRLKSP